MTRFLALLGSVGLAASTAAAANLNITVRANGSSNISVPTGTVVNYELIGTLSDDLNEGLALWGADLTLNCNGAVVALAQGNTPVTPPMDNFVSSPTNTKGINNPAGYGGTPKDGKLLQAGGGQNTIKNTAGNAPFPTGTPILGVAWPASPATLLTGSFTAENNTNPAQDIVCMLSVTNVFANQIKDGEAVENVFLKTEAAGVGTIMNLTVTVTADIEGVELVTSSPACDQSLWRTKNNVITLGFSGPLPAGTPQVKVLEIGANGAEGEDVTASFTMTPTGNSLRLAQVGDTGRPPENPVGVIKHRRWYVVRSDNWTGVIDFRQQYVVQIGDANANGGVNSLDVSAVNGFGTCFNVTTNCPEKIRGDVDGNNNINSLDVSAINGIGTSFPVSKPSGHACQ